jgi:hypothetical protein
MYRGRKFRTILLILPFFLIPLVTDAEEVGATRGSVSPPLRMMR